MDALSSAYDLTLQDLSTSPTITVQLVLAEDEESGQKMLVEQRHLPEPSQVEGEVSTHPDPLVDLVWKQDDWSGGCGQLRYDREHPNRYLGSSGIDARGANALGPWVARSPISLFVRNGSAEDGTNGWTEENGASLTQQTSEAQQGTYGFRVTDSSGALNDRLFSQTLTNPTVYQSREIRVYANCRRSAGAEAGMRILINDGVSTTRSTSITNAAFTTVSVVATIGATATVVRIGFDLDAAITTTHTFAIDSIKVFPTGGVEWFGTTSIIQATVREWYSAFGRCLCKWNRTTSVYEAVYIDSANPITDILGFDGNILIAFGSAARYRFGSDTTWTQVNVATGDSPRQFAIGRDNNGALAVWQSTAINDTRLHYSLVPANATPGWSGNLACGDDSLLVTNLFSFLDSVVAGKEEGLFIYRQVWPNTGTATGANRMFNLLPEWEGLPSSTHWRTGVAHQGWLYLVTSAGSLVRYDGAVFEDLAYLFDWVGGLPGVGDNIVNAVGEPNGNIRGLVSDLTTLWLLVDSLEQGDTTARPANLFTLTESDDEFILHQVENSGLVTVAESFAPLGITEADGLALVDGSIHVYVRRFALTPTNNVENFSRYPLPIGSMFPYMDGSNVTVTITDQGLVTSVWDAGLPSEDKAFLWLDFWTRGTSDASSRNLTVEFSIDGGAWTTLGSTNTSAATIPVLRTLSFNDVASPTTAAVGGQIAFRFSTSGIGAATRRLILSFELHAAIRPLRFRQWDLTAEVGPEVLLRNGTFDPQSRTTVLSRLSTLEQQVYPITLIQDWDADGTTTSIPVFIRELVRLPDSLPGRERIRLVLQEARTTSA